MHIVLQETNAEQPVIIDVKRYHHRLLFFFDISDVLNLQAESLAIIDALHRFALFVQFDACKQRRMCCHNRLYRCFELFFIQTAIKRI